MTLTKYGHVLQRLLPTGPALKAESGTDLEDLLNALGEALAYVETRGTDLLEEFDPRTTDELLADWERVFNLPGTNPSPPTTTAGRRAALWAKMLGYGDPTAAFFIETSLGAGYTADVTDSRYFPFVAGSNTGYPIFGWAWAYLWTLFALSGDDDNLLKWTIDQLVPDHTQVQYFQPAIVDWFMHYKGWAWDLFAAAYGNGLYVVVGEADGADATIATSDDLITWVGQANPTNTTLRAIAFGEGIFVAVGDAAGGDAYIITSPDGITWTERANAQNIGLNGVTYGNGIFVAVGNNVAGDAYILTSTDGTVWTEQANPEDVDLFAVTYGGGMFVAVGESLGVGAGAYMIRSTDGTTWTKIDNFVTVDLLAISYGNEKFIAVGDETLVSSDGIAWTNGTNVTGSLSLTFVNGHFVLGMDVEPYIRTTVDGLTWTSREIVNSNDSYLFGGCNGPKGCLLTGDAGYVAKALPFPLFPDVDWVEQTGTGSLGSYAITSSDTLFVIVGEAFGGSDSLILTSTDGVTWTERVSPKTVNLVGVTYSRNLGLYVAVGAHDGVDATILTSLDGVTWTERAPTVAKVFALYDVIADPTNISNKLVAVGQTDGTNAYILTSTDGLTWTERSPMVDKSINLYAVAFGSSPVDYAGDRWIAVGGADGVDAYILCSDTATANDWVEQANPKSIALNGIAYGNGRWVAVGEADGTDAYIIYTLDGGTTWVEAANPKNIALNHVCYANGVFVAVGDADGTDAYCVISKDGITWTEVTNTRNINLLGTTYKDDTFCSCGWHWGAGTPYILTAEQFRLLF